ncbi:hypothetical protein VIGAN_04271000, partial [Vigna angularis var. angularis]
SLLSSLSPIPVIIPNTRNHPNHFFFFHFPKSASCSIFTHHPSLTTPLTAKPKSFPIRSSDITITSTHLNTQNLYYPFMNVAQFNIFILQPSHTTTYFFIFRNLNQIKTHIIHTSIKQRKKRPQI